FDGDAGVGVETLVLGGEHRPTHLLGNVLERHRLPSYPSGTGHRGAVRPEEHVVLLSGIRVQVGGYAGGGVGDHERPGAETGGGGEGGGGGRPGATAASWVSSGASRCVRGVDRRV